MQCQYFWCAAQGVLWIFLGRGVLLGLCYPYSMLDHVQLHFLTYSRLKNSYPIPDLLFSRILYICCSQLLKAGFHMSEKSQTVEDFTFCPPSQILPIYLIVVRILSPSLATSSGTPCLRVIGRLESSNRGLVMSNVHPRTSPMVQN